MHSQPRLKLPAERLPKLERKKKKDLRNRNCEFKPTLKINKNEKQLQEVHTGERETIFNHYSHRTTNCCL